MHRQDIERGRDMSNVQNVMYLDVELNESSTELDIVFDDMSGTRFPFYEGPYLVDPRKVEQTLNTKSKSMSDNVTVKPIYYAETSNLGGGLTAVIGME